MNNQPATPVRATYNESPNMNRKQRRQASHRSPQLAARAQFEQKLRDELKKHDVKLIAASTGEDQNKKPLWVLTLKTRSAEIVMSVPPGSVLTVAKAVLEKLEELRTGKPQEVVAATTLQGPDQAPIGTQAAAEAGGAVLTTGRAPQEPVLQYPHAVVLVDETREPILEADYATIETRTAAMLDGDAGPLGDLLPGPR